MNEHFIPIPDPARAAPPAEVSLRKAMMWIAVAVLAGAVVTAFISVLQVIEIWFDYQYVPIARGILAVLVAVVALYVVRILVRRPATPPPS